MFGYIRLWQFSSNTRDSAAAQSLARKIVSHVKLMYLHSVPISWLIPLVISWLNYLLCLTSATHIIEIIHEFGKNVTQLNVDCT